jgi:hypothetical protein
VSVLTRGPVLSVRGNKIERTCLGMIDGPWAHFWFWAGTVPLALFHIIFFSFLLS